jgi:glycosyltransferase involved in cell wall biosynthesis
LNSKAIVISCISLWYLKNFRGDLIRELSKSYRVVLLVPDEEGIDFFKPMGVEVIKVFYDRGGINPINDFFSFLALIKTLINLRPDLVMNFTVKPNIYCGLAASLLNIPYINNLTGLGTAFIDRPLLQLLVVFLYRIAHLKLKFAVVQNKEDFNLLCRLKVTNEKNCIIIQGSGVDTDFFKPQTAQIQYDFIMIARVIKDKGVIEYLKASQQLKQEYPKLRFALLGSFDIQNRGVLSKEILNEYPHIHYLDKTDNVQSVLHTSKVVVLPSYREGLSRVLIEAGACGKVCITTNTPGCKDVITNMYNGLICEPKNVDSLKKSMSDFLKLTHETVRQMEENSRKRIIEMFSSKIIIQMYLQLISKFFK